MQSKLEYVALRLLRKFIFRDEFLLRFGRLVPYYRVNRNQAVPHSLADDYVKNLANQGFEIRGKRILEVGVGATNSTAYEICARMERSEVVALEPFVPLASGLDEELLQATARRHAQDSLDLARKVRRVDSLRDQPDRGFDLILSSSVLEHVEDPRGLFSELKRVLNPSGAMLHLVDYRDHFFKYPYQFLTFSDRTWRRWLNPGDLPRWRAYDHVAFLREQRFEVKILQLSVDHAAFAKVADSVDPLFNANDPLLPVSMATLWATPVQ